MKVKVGDRVYDGEQEPVMVILTPADKANIANMDREATMYCCFPSGMSHEAVARWMEERE